MCRVSAPGEVLPIATVPTAFESVRILICCWQRARARHTRVAEHGACLLNRSQRTRRNSQRSTWRGGVRGTVAQPRGRCCGSYRMDPCWTQLWLSVPIYKQQWWRLNIRWGCVAYSAVGKGHHFTGPGNSCCSAACNLEARQHINRGLQGKARGGLCTTIPFRGKCKNRIREEEQGQAGAVRAAGRKEGGLGSDMHSKLFD